MTFQNWLGVEGASNQSDIYEQPRFFECFQCPMNRINIGKMSPAEHRYLCVTLDVENALINLSNDAVSNPLMQKPLKGCPYHPEVDVYELIR